MNLQEAIRFISELPPIPNWYIAEDKQVRGIISNLRCDYGFIAQWLRHLMLGEQEPDFNTNPTLLAYYPIALDLQRLFELVTATRLRLLQVQPQWREIPSTVMWVACTTSDALSCLNDMGISSFIETGVASPKITSKTDFIAHQSEALRQYDIENTPQAKQAVFSHLRNEAPQDWCEFQYREWIEGVAFKIAQKSNSFRKLYWNPYLESKRSINDLIRNCEVYQLSYLLPDGTQVTTGKHTKLPKNFDSDVRKQQSSKRRRRDKQKQSQNVTKSLQNKQMIS